MPKHDTLSPFRCGSGTAYLLRPCLQSTPQGLTIKKARKFYEGVFGIGEKENELNVMLESSCADAD